MRERTQPKGRNVVHVERHQVDIGSQIFRVERTIERYDGSAEPHTLIRIKPRPWVNIVALTKDRRVIFVRQHRHGVNRRVLELPAGMCELHEKSSHAASRELLEETGFAGDTPRFLGSWYPNPALQSNRCSTWLIQNARKRRAPAPDPGEDLEVEVVPLSEVGTILGTGRMRNGLSLAAFCLLSIRQPDMSFW